VLKRRDLERFIELIPDWDELSVGLNWVVLSKSTDCDGYYRRGEIAVCAWPSTLWTENLSKYWYWEHAELLARLGVASGRSVTAGWPSGRRTRCVRTS
jgi:hypothetical protein